MPLVNQYTDPFYLQEKGQPLGVATLDSGGKVPVSQLPNSIMEYKGNWDAATNTPTLVDGVGDTGDVYRVSVAGTQFTPPITFAVGDYVIYNGTKYEKSDATDAVTSVNGFTGAVTLTTTNIAEGTNQYFTTTRARNSLVQGTGINYDPVTGTISTVNNGTVTSVGLSLPFIFNVTGSPVTSSGTLTATLASQAALNVFAVGASPSAPTFQLLTAAHIPTLTSTKISDFTAAARASLSQGTSISYNSSTGVITNSAPDQTVVLNNGTGISVTGTYPNFTITNTAPNTTPNLQQVTNVGASTTLSMEINPSADAFRAFGIKRGTTTISSAQISNNNNASLSWTPDIATPTTTYRVDIGANLLNYYNNGTIETIWRSGNHPAGVANNQTLSGPTVYSNITTNSAGHLTAVGTRSLTAADISAAPATGSPNYAPISGSTNYIQNTTSVQASSNFWISGQGVTDSSFQIRKVGSNAVNGALTLYNVGGTRGANFQLNADATPGLSTWVHNGTSWIERQRLNATDGSTTFIGENGEGINLTRLVNIVSSATAGIRFNANNASSTVVSYSQIWGIIEANTAGTESGAIAFNTRNAGTLSEKMRLSAAGILTVNNDIISTSAGSNGTITARSTSTGDAIFTADVSGVSGTSIRTFRTGGRTGIINNANEAISILTNGNVGIRNTAPTASLDILAASGVELGFTGANSANIYHQTSGQSLYLNTNVAPIYIGANGSGTQHLNLLTNGNVGIGVINPLYRLHINSGASPSSIISQSTVALGTGSGSFYQAFVSNLPTATNQRLGGVTFGSNTTGTTYVTGAHIEGWSDGAWTSGVSHPTSMRFMTTGDGENAISERMRITSAGRVGIGTDIPATPLHVSGIITTSIGLYSESGNDLTIWAQNGGNMNFYVGDSNLKMSLDNSGNLGVGIVPLSARGSVIQAQGNVWSTDAYILGIGSIPWGEFGMSGSNVFLRTMGSQNLELTTGASNIRATILSTGGIDYNTGGLQPIRTVAANASVTIDDHTIIANANSIVLNLPFGSAVTGLVLHVMNNNRTGVTFNPAVSLNGASTTSFPANAKYTLQYDGVTWYVIND